MRAAAIPNWTPASGEYLFSDGHIDARQKYTHPCWLGCDSDDDWCRAGATRCHQRLAISGDTYDLCAAQEINGHARSKPFPLAAACMCSKVTLTLEAAGRFNGRCHMRLRGNTDSSREGCQPLFFAFPIVIHVAVGIAGFCR